MVLPDFGNNLANLNCWSVLIFWNMNEADWIFRQYGQVRKNLRVHGQKSNYARPERMAMAKGKQGLKRDTPKTGW